MEGLQRSSSTFRRSGSSGLVWDERFLTEDAEAKARDGTEEPQPELRHSRSVGSLRMLRHGGSDDKKQKKKKQEQKEEEHDHQVFQTKDVAPDLDPPSPRVSGCILCAIFRGSISGSAAHQARAKPRKKQR